MNYRIGLIAPYQTLIARATKLAADKGIPLVSCRAVLDDAAKEAENMEKRGIDVLVVREITDMYIKGRIHIPVVPIRVSGTDILKALIKARRISKSIALANFCGRYKDIGIIRGAYDIDFQEFSFFTKEEAYEKIRNLKGKVELIIGGGLTYEVALEQGFRGVLIETTDDSIIYALEVASNVAKSRFEEEQKRHQLTTIVNLASGGIVAVDQTGRTSVYNEAAEEIFQIPHEEVIGRDAVRSWSWRDSIPSGPRARIMKGWSPSGTGTCSSGPCPSLRKAASITAASPPSTTPPVSRRWTGRSGSRFTPAG
jgi:PAS domain-containing protein